MKNLVICCDGTWNDEKTRTHIVRINDAAKQILDPKNVYYDEGVGAKDTDDELEENEQGWLTTIADNLGGGAFGKGISKNIREAYDFIAETYQDGDRIHIFGFSRGAYTARSLAGLIAYAGLLQKNDVKASNKAYKAYRTADKTERENHPWLKSEEAKRARRDVPIHFLGVFDTVGALGIPVGWLQSLDEWINPKRAVRFHDTDLGKDVIHARHAMAVDEQRGPFKPTLWTGTSATDPRVRQVWFAGVHSDVGGGYKDKRLAEIPLAWMLDELAESGLDLRPAFDQHDPLEPNALGKMHDSVSNAYKLAHFLPSIDYHIRPIGRAERKRRDADAQEVPGEGINWSVPERLQANKVPIEDDLKPYRPKALPHTEEGKLKPIQAVSIIDRRKAERFEANSTAEIPGTGPCTIRDLSRTGARLTINQTPQTSTFTLKTTDARIGERNVSLRWHNPNTNELGVHFDEPLDHAA